VDDVLYARTTFQSAFRPVGVDTDRYAQVDLWRLPPAVRARVGVIPVDERTRDVLSRWDARKNGADAASLAALLLGDWRRLHSDCASLPAPLLGSFVNRELPRAGPETEALYHAAILFSPGGAANPVSRTGARTEDLSLALAAAGSPGALAAVGEYVTAGASATPPHTAYARGSHNLDLLIKANLLQRMERDVTLVSGGASLETIAADRRRAGLIEDARELSLYLERFYDERNFPEFPAGGAFLGPDQYFAMGDNRYNSLDFRFSEGYRLRALDPSDSSSILYSSLLAPFPLERRYIEGYAVLRVWPFSRMGVIR
jgi:hypothetical protein